MHHKEKQLLPVFFVLFILCLVMVKVVGAGRWVGDDVLEYALEDGKICRDGVVVLSVHTSSSDAPPPEYLDNESHEIYARLFDTTSTTEPDESGHHGDYPEAYGPRLTANQVVTLTYHTDTTGNYIPIAYDENTDLYLYAVSELTWSRALPVGSRIMVQNSWYDETLLVGTVQDCYLNRLTVPPGGTVIDNQHLYADTGIMDQSDAIFRLDSLPAHGALWLDGMPLKVGDTFTQDDVDNGLLRYDHDAGGATGDSFGYTLLSTTSQLSTSPSGANSNGDSFSASISADGRAVVFDSGATNLVEDDLNGFRDIFHHDLYTGQTTLISLADNDAQGDGDSIAPAISRDGGMVVYESDAKTLVSGDAMSDCEYQSDINNLKDIFSVDLFLSTDGAFHNTRRISVESVGAGECEPGNGSSYQAQVATDSWGDGAIVFSSNASNLEEDDLNATTDVFTNDGSGYFDIAPVSVDQGGQFGDGNSSSPSLRKGPYFGPFVIAFQSDASNLVSGISDTNTRSDIFVRDGNGPLVRVSVSSGGVQSNGHSFNPSISANGRFVAFMSGATNLVADSDTNGKSDVFLRDRDTDGDSVLDEVGAVSTTLISSAFNGGAGNDASSQPYISANGRFIVFTSWAGNIVNGDTNGAGDVFVYDRQLDKMTRVSVASDGSQADGGSFNATISDDGDYVVFESTATNLVEDDNNNKMDVFVHYAGFSATFPLELLPSEQIYIPIIMGSPNG